MSGWTDLALADGSGEVNKKLEDDRRERRRILHLCPVAKELFSVQCGSVIFICVCVEIKAHLDTPFPKIPLQHTMFQDSLYILRKIFGDIYIYNCQRNCQETVLARQFTHIKPVRREQLSFWSYL